MRRTNMESILNQTINNDNTHTSAKKPTVKSSSASQMKKQSANSTEPSKSSKASESSALKVTKTAPKPKKSIHNNTKSTKSTNNNKNTQLIHSSDVKSNNKSGHMLYWSTQLDLRLVAQMYALEHVNHLKNFALVANYLFSHRKTVSDIVGNYDDANKKRYHMYYSVYMMQNKPKAEKNYRRYHRVTAKK